MNNAKMINPWVNMLYQCFRYQNLYNLQFKILHDLIKILNHKKKLKLKLCKMLVRSDKNYYYDEEETF